MNRTGVPDDHTNAILGLCRSIASSGLRFRGVHYYDGHLSKYDIAERCAHAHRGYERLMRIVDTLATHGIEVPEVITAGTPALPCSLSFPRFLGAPFVHRVSPGTVIYCDATSLAQLPPEYGYQPAAVVMTRVVSHPAAGLITCDAGHKTVSADAGVPTCAVLGHPALEPLAPSEEHLPMRAADSATKPAIGEVLYLVPRHVCPTVNNFDEALIVSSGKLIGVESVSARGRERPIKMG
jgi:D-serine deaminase-like pyridoxal phosphate-dependent protein